MKFFMAVPGNGILFKFRVRYGICGHKSFNFLRNKNVKRKEKNDVINIE